MGAWLILVCLHSSDQVLGALASAVTAPETFYELGRGTPLWPSVYIKHHPTQVTAVNLVYFLKENTKGGVFQLGAFSGKLTTLLTYWRKPHPDRFQGWGWGLRHSTQVQKTHHPCWALLCHLTKTCNVPGTVYHYVPGTVPNTVYMKSLTYSYNNLTA